MGLEACVNEGEGCEEGETEAEGCCAGSGKAASAMVISKQHFNTMCLIFAFCSVAYGMRGYRPASAITDSLVRSLPGTRDFDALNYTRGVYIRLGYKFSWMEFKNLIRLLSKRRSRSYNRSGPILHFRVVPEKALKEIADD